MATPVYPTSNPCLPIDFWSMQRQHPARSCNIQRIFVLLQILGLVITDALRAKSRRASSFGPQRWTGRGTLGRCQYKSHNDVRLKPFQDYL